MAITWLHISDLHRGQPGDTRWDLARQILLPDMQEWVDANGKPDLVLFTGDLAYAGKEEDYRAVDQTLDDIQGVIGDQAILVSVPGNHDLCRPDKHELAALACKQYFVDDDVRKGLLAGHKSTVAFFKAMFSAYEAWWQKRVLPRWQQQRLRFAQGMLPGDFVLTVEKDDLRLGIAGFNSSYLHFGDAERESLAIEYEQLSLVKSLPRWHEEHDSGLLLMHHPRNWFHPTAQQRLLDTIYGDNTFAACCFGHMHEHGAETIVSGGTVVRRWIQAASIFGLEYYGRKAESRSIGYGWGRLERSSKRVAALTRWPRVARRGEGESTNIFPGDVKPYPQTEQVALRERRVPSSCRVSITAVLDEFVFVSHLQKRIEDLRPGLTCVLISADELPPAGPDVSELQLVLVGGLRGRADTLLDAIRRPATLVLRARNLDAQALQREDADLKGLAELISARAATWFTSEDDILASVRLALEHVCKAQPILPQGQLDDPYVEYVLADLEGRRQEAKALFAQGEFEQAQSKYEDLAARTSRLRDQNPELVAVRAAWTRASLNVAICRIALSRTEEARTLLVSVDPDSLDYESRCALVKAFVNVRELERAEMLIANLPAGAQLECSQLLQVARGQVPTTTPESADALTYSVRLLTREEQFRRALEWTILARSRFPNDNVLGQLAVLEGAVLILEAWAWAEQLSEPLRKDDSIELLKLIEERLHDLLARNVSNAVRLRLQYVEYGLAVRTDDGERLRTVYDALRKNGGDVTRFNETFDAAVAVARRGDLESALAMVADPAHSWRTQYRQIGLLSIVGQQARALDGSLLLAQEFPGRLNIEYEVGRQLVTTGRAQEALLHAQLAYDALPGYGQAILLGEVLLALGEGLRAETLVKPLADGGGLIAQSLYAECVEQRDVREAIPLWEAYAVRDDAPEVGLRIVALEFRSGLVSEAAERGWRALQRPDSERFSLATLYQLALLQALNAVQDVHGRVKDIAIRIKKRVKDPQDELVYLQLWSWLQAPKELPAPDFEQLASVGAVRTLSQDEAAQLIDANIARTQIFQSQYHLGHVPVEGFLAEAGVSAARYVSGLGKLYFAPAISPADPDVVKRWPDTVNGVLTSNLELQLCARRGLLKRLEAFLETGKPLFVFADDRARLLEALAGHRLVNPSDRMTRLEAALAVASDVAAVELAAAFPENTRVLTVQDMPKVVAWLQEKGLVSTSRAEVLGGDLSDREPLPTSSRLCAEVGAFLWLSRNGLIEDLVRALGAPLLVTSEAVARLRRERDDAALDVEASRICEETHRWLEDQFRMKRATEVVRPVPDLPKAKQGKQFERQRDWLVNALSWRVAAEALDVYCITLDACARDLFSGLYLPNILHAIQWTKETYFGAQAKYRPLTARMLGFDWLATALDISLPEREQLIRLGCADVADAATLTSLVATNEEAGTSLDKVYDVIEAPLRSRTHSKAISSQLLVARAYSAAVKSLFVRKVTAAAEFAVQALDRLEAHGGKGLLGFLSLVIPAVFDDPTSAYVKGQGEKYTPSATSSAGRLFAQISAWASASPSRWPIFDQAAGDTVALIDQASGDNEPNGVTLGVLQLLATVFPHEAGIDLSGAFLGALATMGAVWTDSPLKTIGIEVTQRTEGVEESVDITFEDAIRECAKHVGTDGGPELSPLMATWKMTVLDDGVAFRAPIEALLLRASMSGAEQMARGLAVAQGPHDGLLYSLLQECAANPDARSVRRALARRAIRSPWKQVLRDPSSILYWGSVDAVHTGAPVRIEQLRQLLSEQASQTSDTFLNRVAEYMRSHWKDRTDVKGLFITAGSVPGSLGFQVAAVMASDANLELVKPWLEAAGSSSFGQLWCAVAALWFAAAEDRTLVGWPEASARTLLEGILTNLVKRVAADSEFGHLEAATLRQCRRVVSRFRPDPNEILWLTYRLFGWFWTQGAARDTSEMRRTFEEIARVADLGDDAQPPTDPMDPKAWIELPDLRLAAILNVLALGEAFHEKDVSRWTMPISDELMSELVRVASRRITDVDRSLRRFSTSEVRWVGTAMPQESALFVVVREAAGFMRLDEASRLGWLQELPTGEPGNGIQEEAIVGRLLIGAAVGLPSLSEIERATLAERLATSTATFMCVGVGQAIALATLLRTRLVATDLVWSRVSPYLSDEDPGPTIARVYLESLTELRPEDLVERVKNLLDALRGRSALAVMDRLRADALFRDETALLAAVEESIAFSPT